MYTVMLRLALVCMRGILYGYTGPEPELPHCGRSRSTGPRNVAFELVRLHFSANHHRRAVGPRTVCHPPILASQRCAATAVEQHKLATAACAPSRSGGGSACDAAVRWARAEPSWLRCKQQQSLSSCTHAAELGAIDLQRQRIDVHSRNVR